MKKILDAVTSFFTLIREARELETECRQKFKLL
jgi:hypothetical protein